MTRHEEREIVFQILFETEFHTDCVPSEILTNRLAETGIKETPYIRDTYFGVIESLDETDALIAETAHKWKLSRMAVVTRTLLRLSVFEMTWGGIPPKATINEAVELAKVYDEDAAPAFINGILNQIARKNGLIKDASVNENDEGAAPDVGEPL